VSHRRNIALTNLKNANGIAKIKNSKARNEQLKTKAPSLLKLSVKKPDRQRGGWAGGASERDEKD
jgi:hypothetical protein